MEESAIAFNARAIFTWSADRVYRVYVRDDALYFIRIGGQNLGTAVAAQFGLVGALVGQAVQKRTEAKRQATTAAQDQQDAQDLLSRHKDNFRIVSGEALASSVEPPTNPAGHGVHLARWLLTLPDKKLTLQLEQRADVEAVLAHLPRFFGDKLNVNVRWDEGKKRYQKI
jgi:hypothetical protein